MNNYIYDLSRFTVVEAVERLNILCVTYNQMCLDNNLDYENEQLKKELSEIIPIFKKEIISRINEL